MVFGEEGMCLYRWILLVLERSSIVSNCFFEYAL